MLKTELGCGVLIECKYNSGKDLTRNKEKKELYGYKSIEKESFEKAYKMVEFLNENGIYIKIDDKKVLKLKLIQKLNNMNLEKLNELKILIDNEILRCKAAGIHIHRYKYKMSLYKLVSKILNEKVKNT